MNPLVIVVPAIVILAGVLLVAAARRRDTDDATGLLSRETLKRDRGESPVLVGAEQPTGREVERSVAIERRGDGGGELVTAGPADLAPYVPPDADAIGVTRRQFFNRSIVLLMGLSLSGFGAAILAFLWPQPKGGFGSKIRVGNVEDLKAEIAANNGFLYVAEGRMWLTQYPEAALERAAAAYDQPVLNSLEAGVAVLYQKCPHLGCRVPECETSQWFECPCHGSQYNQAGEKKGGPAPRGMDRFATEVTGGVLSVDTGAVIQGPPIGVNTTGQEAEGPNCVGAGSH
jgi:cytochrome b6-f complex iron-sulfur subunit